MKTETQFKPLKIANVARLSKELLKDPKYADQPDFFNDQFVVRIFEAFLLQRVAAEQTVTVYSKRPTFFDWLFRRYIQIDVKVTCHEVIKHPNKVMQDGESVIMYDVKQTDNP